MFYLFSKLPFKSSRISVAALFCGRLELKCLPALGLGLGNPNCLVLSLGLWVIQQYLLRSRMLLPLLCPFLFDSSVLCKVPSFQCVASETYCNKDENL